MPKKEIKEKIIEILKRIPYSHLYELEVENSANQILELFEKEKQKSYDKGYQDAVERIKIYGKKEIKEKIKNILIKVKQRAIPVDFARNRILELFEENEKSKI